ncbi:unnamed protein product [Caretta caretta]
MWFGAALLPWPAADPTVFVVSSRFARGLPGSVWMTLLPPATGMGMPETTSVPHTSAWERRPSSGISAPFSSCNCSQSSGIREGPSSHCYYHKADMGSFSQVCPLLALQVHCVQHSEGGMGTQRDKKIPTLGQSYRTSGTGQRG